MPRKSENQHVNPAPHLDGEKESVINDPLATAGSKMGVTTNSNVEFGMERSPFKFIPKVDPIMQRFEKLMRGTKLK